MLNANDEYDVLRIIMVGQLKKFVRGREVGALRSLIISRFSPGRKAGVSDLQAGIIPSEKGQIYDVANSPTSGTRTSGLLDR